MALSIFGMIFSAAFIILGSLRLKTLAIEVKSGCVENRGSIVYWEKNKLSFITMTITIFFISIMFVVTGFLFFVHYLGKLNT
jgi:hypothetical protein